MAKLFITTYNLYNSGLQFASENSGKWYDVSDYTWFEICETLTNCEKELNIYNGSDIEPMATDYEDIPEKLYSESISEKLFTTIQEFSNLDDDKKGIVQLLLDDGHCDNFQAAMGNVDNVVIYYCDTFEKLAEQFVDDGLYGDIPNSLKNYIDYEKIGRDLSYDDYTIGELNGETIIYQI